MARLPTCPYCKKNVSKEDNSKKYQNRTYHISCYQKIMQEKYETRQDNLEPKEELYNYICEVYGVSEVPSMIIAQINKYMTENANWKYSGILYTIKYIVNIKGEDLKNNPNIKGVGFLPYTYEEARNYFLEMKRNKDNLTEQLEGKTLDDFVNKKKIKVKTTEHTAFKQIDIGEI